MPRPKSDQPSYRYHVSGQAVVTFCGQNFYLGPHDSPQSWAKYYSTPPMARPLHHQPRLTGRNSRSRYGATTGGEVYPMLDYDPSGFDLERSLPEKLSEHCARLVIDADVLTLRDPDYFQDVLSFVAEFGDTQMDEYKTLARRRLDDFAEEDDSELIYWRRLALNESHFDEFDLYELKPKETDTHTRQFVERYGIRCSQEQPKA